MTELPWDTVIPIPEMWQAFTHILAPNGCIVLTAVQPFATDLINANRKMFRYELIWRKNISTQYLSASRRPLKIHENILIFAYGVTVYHPQMTDGEPYSMRRRGVTNHYSSITERTPTSNAGTRYPQTVLDFAFESDRNRDDKQWLHSSRKPLALFEYLIRTFSNPGDLVVDPCVGSGTTAVAARNTRRRFICGDNHQPYVDIANARLAEAWTPSFLPEEKVELPQQEHFWVL